MRLFRGSRRTWAPAWAAYPGFVDDAFAMYFVDLAACDRAPVAGLPVRLDVELLLAATDDEGMPTNAELRLVQHIDDVLTRRVGRRGVYVGRVMCAGTVRFVGYLSELPATQFTLGEERPVRVSVAADPEWAYVRERLTPDASQRHIVDDLAVVTALLDRGDDLASPRPVDHSARFADESAARAAAAELSEQGYAVSVGAAPSAVRGGAPAGYLLEATRIDPVDSPGVHKLTWTVRELIGRHGGEYTGWDCSTAG
jgi:hypothetical protein